MQSRMDKYYATAVENEGIIEETAEPKLSRTRRNDKLYKEVSSLKIESFDVNSNVSVIGKSSKNIDIQDVQEILDKKYHEKPKKKSFGDSEMKDIPKINLDETREYDINSIMEKARSNKQVNYEEDRLKKLKNTQYDILKNLDIGDNKNSKKEKISKEKEVNTDNKKGEKTNKELLSLIDTITTKELINERTLEDVQREDELLKADTSPIQTVQDTLMDNTLTATGELDPLDILSDLRGNDENTKVLGINDLRKTEESIQLDRELIKDLEDTKYTKTDIDLQKKLDKDAEVAKDEGSIAAKKIKEAEKILKDEKEKERSFTSTLTTLSKTNSFDDFADLREDMKITRILIKILIVVIVIVFIIGCIFLANKFLGLGLF